MALSAGSSGQCDHLTSGPGEDRGVSGLETQAGAAEPQTEAWSPSFSWSRARRRGTPQSGVWGGRPWRAVIPSLAVLHAWEPRARVRGRQRPCLLTLPAPPGQRLRAEVTGLPLAGPGHSSQLSGSGDQVPASSQMGPVTSPGRNSLIFPTLPGVVSVRFL